MLALYDKLLSVDPDARNAVLTVVDGADFGDKCLLCAGELAWERDADGFFARHIAAIRAIDRGGTREIDGRQVFCELPGCEPSLVICGGGHVSMPLIRIGRMLGWPVTVIEDRPAFADNARRAGASRVLCEPFAAGLSRVPGDADTFFVIVTRGHRYDRECLGAISRKKHAYIGMIGSRRRVAMVKQGLIDGEGCDPGVIGGVHAPIGLDIGAETPEEIAVAIMAEIIQVRRASGRTNAWPRALLSAVTDPADRQTPGALVTIVARRGSAPRDVGAKMLVRPDGRIAGTVGGGCAESEIIRRARMLLDDPAQGAQIFDVDMTAEAAEDAGMVCGGTIRVLMEPIAPEIGSAT